MIAGYLLALCVACLTVVSQLLLKWRVTEAGDLPSTTAGRIDYFRGLLTDPWVIGLFALGGAAAILYFAALSQIELSRAVLALSTSYVGVVLLSGVFFDEPISLSKAAGLALIMGGFLLSTR